MKHGGKRGFVTYEASTFGVPCKNPEKHKDIGQWNEYTEQYECWQCNSTFERALPWNKGKFGTSPDGRDEATFALKGIGEELRNSKRRYVTYSDCWAENHPGYAIEWFGIDMGEHEDIESYQYERLVISEKPKLLVPILRERICHEPTMREAPVYLEIISYGSEYDVSIQGLDPRLDMTPLDLIPIIKARDIHFNRPPMGLALRNPKLWDTWKGFIKAAETLGSKGEPFSIPNLDDFLKAIEGQEMDGEELSKEAAKRIRLAYDLARHDKGIVMKPSRGGPQNVKVPTTDAERKELGRQYLELKGKLKGVRSEYNRYVKQKKDWRTHLKTDNQVFIEYPDVLDKLDDPDKPKYTPSNLAVEIAARRSIKAYSVFSLTPKHLKEIMILPPNNIE